MQVLSFTVNWQYCLKFFPALRLDKEMHFVYNIKVIKSDDEEEYSEFPIFRELPHGEKQYDGSDEVASELRVPTACAQ